MINLVTFSKIHKAKKNLLSPLFSVSTSFSLELSQTIIFEKRKRNQAYFTLDYLLSRVTYFDFFSTDAFTICKYAKYFAQYLNLKVVTPELLLLSCFYCESSLSPIFLNYEFEEVFEKLFGKKEEESSHLISLSNFKDFLASFQEESFISNQNIEYSHPVTQLFLKSAEYALTQFKNPVITSEILFLTLIDEKKYVTSKLIKKIFGSDTECYLVRYQLIKNLHAQEANIRGKISKNQQYFAYLLKTQVSENAFNFLLKKDSLKEAVLIFRNLLIAETMKTNLNKKVFKEVKKSIQLSNPRKYSS